MPLYEYVCDQDSTVLEVQRPMADSDKPLPDPEGKGRSFTRKLSTCCVGSSTPSASPPPPGGGCGCGLGGGGCSIG